MSPRTPITEPDLSCSTVYLFVLIFFHPYFSFFFWSYGKLKLAWPPTFEHTLKHCYCYYYYYYHHHHHHQSTFDRGLWHFAQWRQYLRVEAACAAAKLSPRSLIMRSLRHPSIPHAEIYRIACHIYTRNCRRRRTADHRSEWHEHVNRTEDIMPLHRRRAIIICTTDARTGCGRVTWCSVRVRVARARMINCRHPCSMGFSATQTALLKLSPSVRAGAVVHSDRGVQITERFDPIHYHRAVPFDDYPPRIVFFSNVSYIHSFHRQKAWLLCRRCLDWMPFWHLCSPYR